MRITARKSKVRVGTLVDFLSGAGGVALMAIVFVVALSIIVAVHEYGHYIVGRWTGIHAEVFSLGFGPVLASRTDKRGTKWQLAALPLGGYVKFMGDADAASVRSGALDGLSADERRHTMAGAPLWARSLTVAAGPMANFILGFLIILTFVVTMGMPADTPVVASSKTLNVTAEPLLPGDKILALGGVPTATLEDYGKALEKLPVTPTVTWTVERAGVRLDVAGAHPSPLLIGQVLPKSAAGDAGLQAGDIITKADGVAIAVYSELVDIVKGSQGKPITLTVWRAGETFDATMTPRRRDVPLADNQFETRWQIGLISAPLIELQTRSPGLFEAISTAAQSTWGLLTASLSGLWHIVTGMISTCNLSGPIGMAEVMGDAARAGPQVFFERLAVLSLGIGLLNLFPIPVLDGGHLVFHAYEAVMRRPPTDKALRVLMSVGLTILLSLMAFALSNDLFCV
jgi:regulator of sigma E protease